MNNRLTLSDLSAFKDLLRLRRESTKPLTNRETASLALIQSQITQLLEPEPEYSPEQIRPVVRRFFRRSTDRIAEGYISIRRDWRITDLHTHGEDTYSGQVIGADLWQVFPELLGTPLETRLRRGMAERRPVEFETEGLTRDRLYFVSIDPSDAGINVRWTDRSEPEHLGDDKEQLVEEIQRQAALLEAIFEVDPGGIAVLVGPELRFSYVNPAYRYICPDPQQDPIHRTYDQVWSQTSKHKYRDRLRKVLMTGQPFQKRGVEHYFRDCTRRIFTLQARRIMWENEPAVMLLMWDTTEISEALSQAEFERTQLQAVLEALPVGVKILDREGDTLDSNPMFEQIWGGKPAATRTPADSPLFQAWWADSRQPLPPEEWASAQAIHHGEVVIGQELRIQRFDGGEAFVFNSAVPIRDARQQVIGCVVAILDITKRKQAEQALRESEERFRTLVQQSSDGIVLLDEQGNIIEWNRAQEQITGLERKDALGEPLWDIQYRVLIPERKTPERRDSLKHISLSMLQTGKSPLIDRPIDAQIQRPDGEIRTIQERVFPIPTQRGVRMGSISRDITEQKRNEVALRESEDRMRLAQEAGGVGTLEWDMQRNHIVWSENLDKIFGLEKGGQGSWFERIHPEDRAAWKGKLANVLADRQKELSGAARVTSPEGKLRWVDLRGLISYDPDGIPLRMIGVIIDTTERRRMEEALCETAFYLNEAERIGHLGTWSRNIDSAETWSSAELNRIYGLPPEGVPTAKSDASYLPEYREVLRQALAAAIRGEGPQEVEVKIARLSDGEIRDIHISGEYNPQTRRILGVAQDITERKQAEDALRRSEAKFRAVVENSHDGILFCRPDGSIVYRSPSYTSVNSFSDDERVGHSGFKAVHPEDLETVRRSWDRMLHHPGLPVTAEYRIQNENGNWLWVETTAINMLENPDIQEIVVTARDITARVQFEEALRMNEQKFFTMFQNSPLVVMLAKPDDGVIVEVNQAGIDLFEYDREEVIGKTSTQLGLFPEQLTRDRLIAEMQQKGSLRNIETTFQTKRGKSLLISVNADRIVIGEHDYFIANVTDITERKQAEAEREQLLSQNRAQAEELAAIFEAISDAVVVYDAEGVSRRANRMAEDVFGFASSGEDCETTAARLNFQYPDGRPIPADQLPITRALRGEQVRGEQYRLINPQGKQYYVLASANPIRGSQGQISGAVAVCHDISDRFQVEQALRESEEKFETAFYGNSSAMVITRIRDGVVLDVNERGLSEFGYSREEVIGRSTYEDLHLWNEIGDRARAIDELQEKGSLHNWEAQFVRKNGDELTGLFSCEVIDLKGEPVIMASMMDVSELKKAEAALAASKQRLEDLLASIQDGFFEVDREWRITFINAVAACYTGKKPSELIGKNIWKEMLFLPADEIESLFLRVMKTRHPQKKELKSEEPPVWFNLTFSPSAAGVTVTMQDITTRKRGELALRESEQRFRSVLEKSLDAAYRRNLQRDVFDYVSPVIEQINGFSPDELGEMTPDQVLDHIHPDDRAEHNAKLKQAMETGAGRLVYRFRAKSGEYRCLEDYVTITKDADGTPLFRTGIIRDITEIKVAQNALQESESKFARAFHGNTAAMTMTRLRDAVILDVNERAKDLFGFSREEIIGRSSIIDLGVWVDLKERERVVSELQKIGAIHNWELHYRRKGGREWTALVSSELIQLGGEQVIISSMMDITELKQVETALAASKQRLEDLLASIQDGFFEVDREWSFTFINERAAGFSHRVPSEMIGERIWDILPFLVGSGQEVLYRRVMETRQPESQVLKGVAVDMWFNLAVNPSANGITVYMQDITERKRAELALQESEQKYRAFFENLSEAIVVMEAVRDDQGEFLDFILRDINPSALQIIGVDRDRVIGIHISNLVVNGQNVTQNYQIYKTVLSTGTPISFETTFAGRTYLVSAVNLDGDFILLIAADITQRKQSEVSLRESEERFRILADSNPLIIWVTDDEGGLQFINRTYANFFGITPEGVAGSSWQPLVHPEDIPAYLQTFQTAFQEHKTFKAIARGRRADGEWRWIQIYAEPRFSSMGEYLGHVGSMTDITEARQAEAALRESEQRLATILASITDCLFTLDLDGRFKSINESALNYFHCTREEILGRLAWEVFPQIVGTVIEQYYHTAATEKVKVHYETQSLITGVWVEADVYPSGEGLLVIFRDITARRQLEADLRQSREQLKMANEAAGVGIWSVDLATRQFFADDLTRSLLGFPGMIPDDLDYYRGLIHPQDLPHVLEVVHRMLEGPDKLEAECRLVLGEGRLRWVALRGQSVTNEDGSPVRLVGVVMDITDHKQREANDVAWQSEIEVQRRLLGQREQERQQIARDLHDGPVQDLTGITLAIRGVLMDGCPPPIAEQLEAIQTGLEEQIQQLRNYAGELRPPALSKFGLAKAIQSNLDILQEKHPEVTIRFEERQVGVLLPEASGLALYRIYQESLINTLKHAEASEVSIRFSKTNLRARLEIWDNGKGFEVPKDWVELARHGHLGLVGMRERAEAVGGRLEIASQPGQGTHLRVTVPLPLET